MKMKEHLLELINKTEQIEKLFHIKTVSPGIAMVANETIYEVQEFRIWIQELKCELQEIYERTNNKFIEESINDLSANFNGWTDRTMFNKVKGDLLAIKRNIDSYYPQSKQTMQMSREKMIMNKKPKIFISHNTVDKPFVEKIVQLIESIGVKRQDIFCSSIPGYGVPNSQDIFEFLREQFEKYELFIVFVHSTNYYNSPISLNEMGAAWVLRSKYISFLLPNFDFSSMTGIINARTAGIKLDADIYEAKDRLNQFKNELIEIFGLSLNEGITWERTRDKFIQEVNLNHPQKSLNSIEQNAEKLSKYAEELLLNASKTDSSRLIIYKSLSGTQIQTEPKCYSTAMGDREFSRWESAFEELLKDGYIRTYGKNGCLWKITDKGYTYLENNFNAE